MSTSSATTRAPPLFTRTRHPQHEPIRELYIERGDPASDSKRARVGNSSGEAMHEWGNRSRSSLPRAGTRTRRTAEDQLGCHIGNSRKPRAIVVRSDWHAERTGPG